MAVAGATAAMLLTGAPAGAAATTPVHVRRHAAPRAGDPVVAWNRILLGVLRTPGAQPATVHPTRSLAIVHAAIYDAAVAIDRRWTPYVGNERAPRRASLTAAVDAAAHSSLVALYPALRPQLDEDYARALAFLPGGVRRSQGIHDPDRPVLGRTDLDHMERDRRHRRTRAAAPGGGHRPHVRAPEPEPRRRRDRDV
jgi:hypothetical protein